jgi:excisionase family DNA binding protein
MEDKLLSTREAASLLGVGTTSIKRWADEGLLPCVKTAGGHRRYERQAVEALIGRPALAGAERSNGAIVAGGARRVGIGLGHVLAEGTRVPREAWVEMLVHGQGSADVIAALDRERAALGSWRGVATALGPVIVDLGRQWESGAISVLQEHLASARLLRALSICSERIHLPADAPRALLMTASSDDHTIGLHLVELVLREAGWAGRWVGRRAPLDQVVRFIEEGQAELVAVSASSYSTDGLALAAQVDRIATACKARGLPLLLGGQGAWPEPPEYGERLRDFEQLRRLLDRLGGGEGG